MLQRIVYAFHLKSWSTINQLPIYIFPSNGIPSFHFPSEIKKETHKYWLFLRILLINELFSLIQIQIVKVLKSVVLNSKF